jgi:diguanylate cyclase (GGDEF)-like protein
VTLLYIVAGKLGLKLAFVNASATAVWPPTGIALAALLILGSWIWPAVFVGAFVVNLFTTGSVGTSIGIAVGNTLEALLGAHLVRKYAGGRQAFQSAWGVFAFAVLAALVSTMVSATCGVTTLVLGGLARWEDYGTIWLVWWLGDATGALIVTPLLLLWSVRPRRLWPWPRMVEAAALFAGLLLVGLMIFGQLFQTTNGHYPMEYVCIPFLVWAAFRFGPRKAATCLVFLSGIAILGTLNGQGPFARATQNESLLLLQAFMGIIAVMILALAAVVAERNRIEAELRHLAVTDPLTGLANYRQLVGVLEGEIQRSERTDRSFAVLLLDVDGLKKINDQYGHLVGSRALCRLARALRRSCRVVDAAARYGGDEFAVVLPETSEEAGWRVAERIAERLVSDQETPRVTVSVGMAVYPRDGSSTETLLSAADQKLYAMKACRGALRPEARPG